MLLCRVSCVDILARSSCTLSMQKFEVGEMFNVGRPAIFSPTNCDSLPAVTTSREITTTNTCIFSKFHLTKILGEGG